MVVVQGGVGNKKAAGVHRLDGTAVEVTESLAVLHTDVSKVRKKDRGFHEDNDAVNNNSDDVMDKKQECSQRMPDERTNPSRHSG